MITECNECPDNVIPNPQKIKITKPVTVTDQYDDEFKVQYKYEVAFDRSHINNRAGASEQEKTFIFDLHIDKVIQPVKRTLHDDIDEDDEFFDFSLELRIDEQSEHPCWTMHFIPDQAEEYGRTFKYDFKKSKRSLFAGYRVDKARWSRQRPNREAKDFLFGWISTADKINIVRHKALQRSRLP